MRTRVRGGVAVTLSKHMLIVRKCHMPMLKGNLLWMVRAFLLG